MGDVATQVACSFSDISKVVPDNFYLCGLDSPFDIISYIFQCCLCAWSVIMLRREPGQLGEGECLLYSVGMEIFILQWQTQ